jgi:GT2 family glycosyltransferase
MHKLIVIIISWNTMEVTRNCLSSLYVALDGIDNEVWVIDNASTDGSVGMIRKDFPQTILIENAINVGFAKANNQALREAKGRYYLLLNSDTIVPKSSIAQLVDFLDSNHDAAVVGPRMINAEGAIQNVLKSLPSLRSELVDCLFWHFPPFSRILGKIKGKTRRQWRSDTKPSQVDILSMACLLIRKEVFDKIGVLGEEYFLFSEESDFFKRMQGGQFISYLLPQVTIVHLGGESRKKRQNDSDEFYYRSRLLFFQKHHKNKLMLIKFIYILFFWWSSSVHSISMVLKGQTENPNKVFYKKMLRVVCNSKIGKPPV